MEQLNSSVDHIVSVRDTAPSCDRNRLTTHHETSAHQAAHVLDLLGDVSVLGKLDVPAGEEQEDVAEDGDDGQRVETQPDAAGTLPSAHGVTLCTHL